MNLIFIWHLGRAGSVIQLPYQPRPVQDIGKCRLPTLEACRDFYSTERTED